MIQNLYSDDIEIEIMARENAIECDELSSLIMRDLAYLTESVFYESGEESEGKGQGIIHSICQKISKMVKAIVDFISNVFKSIGTGFGKQLKPEDYMNADSVKIELNSNAEQLKKELDEEVLNTHKFVKFMSQKTGMDPDEVDKKLASAKKGALKVGGTVLGVTAACILGNKLAKSILGGEKVAKECDELSKKIESDTQSIANLEAKKFELQGKKTLATITRKLGSLNGKLRKSMGAYSEITRGLSKYDRRVHKELKRKKKKSK